MFKKRLLISLLMILLLTFLTVGCGSTQSASTILQNAFEKTEEITSYAFKGEMQIDMDLSKEILDSLEPDEKFAIEMFESSNILFNGIFQLNPYQFELISTVDLNIGDIKTNLTVPVVMNDQKMWIKVPNLPRIEELKIISGKFLEIDLTEQSDINTEDITDLLMTLELESKLTPKIYAIFFKHLDERFIQKINLKNLNLPKEVKGKDAVKFTVTKDNAPELINITFEKVLPEAMDIFFDILSEPKYMELLAIDPDDFLEARQQLETEMEHVMEELFESSHEKFEEMFTELNKIVEILNFEITFITNKDGYITKQIDEYYFKITLPEEVGSGTVTISFKFDLNNINGTQTFDNTFPPAGDIVKLEDFN